MACMAKASIVHLVRGYFDGDGCLRWWRRNNGKCNQAYVGFVGTYEFLERVSELIGVTNKISRRGNVFVFQVVGNRKVRRITDWMYANATVYLDRKYNLWRQMFYSDSYIPSPSIN